MKKDYMKPVIREVSVHQTGMICASGAGNLHAGPNTLSTQTSSNNPEDWFELM